MGMLKIDVWERRGSEGFGEGFEGDEVVFLFAVFLIKMFFLSVLKMKILETYFLLCKILQKI